MQKEDRHAITHRVITMLDRQELEFLDKLGKDALFTTGHKLSYNEILKGLVDFAKDIGLSAENVHSFKALEEKLRQEMPRILEKLKTGMKQGVSDEKNLS